jgi:predicted dehydrogenase
MNLGVVGPGLIWKEAHEPIVTARKNDIRIVGFSAQSEETRRNVSARYPDATVFEDARQMMSSPDIDTVLVLTPLQLNAPMTLDALRASKNVIVEKPLATSADEAATVVAEQKRTKGKVFVLEQVLYTDFWTSIRAVLEQGKIGTPVFFERALHYRLQANQGKERGYGDTAWRIHPSFPFGSLLDGGIHDVAVITRLFGSPSAVRARGRKYREGYGQFDHVIMDFSYGNGMEGVFSHSGYLPESRNYFFIRGTDGTISIDEKTATVESTDGTTTKIVDGARHHENAWTAALDYILRGKEPAYTSQQACEDLRILDAVGKSIATGAPVSLGG